MIESDWIEVVALTALSEADAKLDAWLADHGIDRSEIDANDIRQDLHRTARGSESVYFLRRSTLEALLGRVPDDD